MTNLLRHFLISPSLINHCHHQSVIHTQLTCILLKSDSFWQNLQILSSLCHQAVIASICIHVKSKTLLFVELKLGSNSDDQADKAKLCVCYAIPNYSQLLAMAFCIMLLCSLHFRLILCFCIFFSVLSNAVSCAVRLLC